MTLLKTEAGKTTLFLRTTCNYLGAVAVKPYDRLKVNNALVKVGQKGICQEHIICNLAIGNFARFPIPTNLKCRKFFNINVMIFPMTIRFLGVLNSSAFLSRVMEM
jgi:hypothetical protein